jgi:hypothetical protein
MACDVAAAPWMGLHGLVGGKRFKIEAQRGPQKATGKRNGSVRHRLRRLISTFDVPSRNDPSQLQLSVAGSDRSLGSREAR